MTYEDEYDREEISIFNHLDITVFIHESNKKFNIVGFEVTPRSVPTNMTCEIDFTKLNTREILETMEVVPGESTKI